MTALLKRLFVFAIVVLLGVLSTPPRASVAQTTGLGWDGYTRQIWRGSAGQVAVWLLDPNMNLVDVVIYGPYAGWQPVSITTGNNNYSYILWRTAVGNAAVWIVDPNLNYVGEAISGANPGWNPESIIMGTANTNLRLTWRYVTGEISLWNFNSQLDYLGGVNAGPYYGYDPGPAPEAVPAVPLSLRTQSQLNRDRTMPDVGPRITELMKRLHSAAVERAAKAMANPSGAKKLPKLAQL